MPTTFANGWIDTCDDSSLKWNHVKPIWKFPLNDNIFSKEVQENKFPRTVILGNLSCTNGSPCIHNLLLYYSMKNWKSKSFSFNPISDQQYTMSLQAEQELSRPCSNSMLCCHFQFWQSLAVSFRSFFEFHHDYAITICPYSFFVVQQLAFGICNDISCGGFRRVRFRTQTTSCR